MLTPLEHARHYAARGWRVIPIPAGHKFPANHPAWQRVATTDPGTVLAWWAGDGPDGVGIVTGPESGIFVLDVDPRHGGDDSLAELIAAHGELPDTVEALTGGGGRHLYFTYPPGMTITNNAGLLGVGLDVRGAGGQVLAPPTIHPSTGQPYTWELTHDPLDGQAVADAPAWLLEALSATPAALTPRRPPAPRNPGDPMPGDRYAEAHDWPDILGADGWTLHSTHTHAGASYEMWTRPGKTPREGASASLYYGGSDVLKVFTSSVPWLETEQTYTRFGYYAARHHGGDHAAAARAIRAELGPPGAVRTRGEETDNAPAQRRLEIVHNGRQLDDLTDHTLRALVAANQPPNLFVRAGQLSRLRQDEDERPIIDGLKADHVRLAAADAAHWYRVNKDGERTATSPPLDVCASVLARGEWPLPALAGVVELPVLRPDGTFATAHGYDPATKLYHWHRGQPYQPVPTSPTLDELTNAVALIDEVLCDFPWDTSADRANAWALLITPLVRAIVGQVPMALVDAPEPGTGKGLLVKVAATITIGRAAGLMAWPASDEELEKKVTAALMAGNTMMIFDNVEGTIRSPTLAAVLTADSWQGRVLGRSEMVMVPNRATWACTGNNISVGGDLARRCYRIRLDARRAQPWKRTGFRHTDLEGWVAGHRYDLLHALCVIVRSWWAAGRKPAGELAAMGGYTSWVRTVGGILEHAGVTGFLGNLDAFHAEADQDSAAWEAFLTAWHEQLGEQSVTVGELNSKMADIYIGERFRDALPDDLAEHWGAGGFTKRLGWAIRHRVGRHFGEAGIHLVSMPRHARKNVPMYAVTTRSVALVDEAPTEKPALEEVATCTDANGAGFAGFVQPLGVENYSTEIMPGPAEQNPRNPETRAPAIPDLTPLDLFRGDPDDTSTS